MTKYTTCAYHRQRGRQIETDRDRERESSRAKESSRAQELKREDRQTKKKVSTSYPPVFEETNERKIGDMLHGEREHPRE
jgi:hypothetical protein